MFVPYYPSAATLTVQRSFLPIFPASFNFLVLLTQASLFLLAVLAARALLRVICLNKLLARRSPIIVNDYAAYYQDFPSLTVQHLTAILKKGVPSRPVELPKASLKERIDAQSICAQLVTPAVSSTALPRPQLTELSFQCISESGSGSLTLHAFAHVPISAIIAYLQAVNGLHGQRRPTHGLLRAALTFWACVRDNAYACLKNVISSSPPQRADPIVQELLQSSPQSGLQASSFYTTKPSTESHSPLASIAREHFQGCSHRAISLSGMNRDWSKVTILLDPVYGLCPLGDEVHLVLLLLDDQCPSVRTHHQVRQFLMLDRLTLSWQFACHQELLLYDAGIEGFIGSSSAVSCAEERAFADIPGVSGQQAVYGLDSTEPLECSICLTNPKDAILIPCRHCAACVPCMQGLLQDKCPICRCLFTGWIHLPWAGPE